MGQGGRPRRPARRGGRLDALRTTPGASIVGRAPSSARSPPCARAHARGRAAPLLDASRRRRARRRRRRRSIPPSRRRWRPCGVRDGLRPSAGEDAFGPCHWLHGSAGTLSTRICVLTNFVSTISQTTQRPAARIRTRTRGRPAAPRCSSRSRLVERRLQQLGGARGDALAEEEVSLQAGGVRLQSVRAQPAPRSRRAAYRWSRAARHRVAVPCVSKITATPPSPSARSSRPARHRPRRRRRRTAVRTTSCPP